MAIQAKSKMIGQQIAALKALGKKAVEAGWFESDRYPASKGQSVGIAVAEIARLNEFGGTIQHPGGTKYITDAATKKGAQGTRFVGANFGGTHNVTGPHTIPIPARPFMRLAWTNFRNNNDKLSAKIASGIVNGKITAEQGLGQIGDELVNQIVKSIRDGGWEANAPSTVRRKGFDKPLIDTGHMWQSANSKVS